MALRESFKATSVQTIKLAEMNAIPNTEDLRYMLTECTMQRKPVLLPFKNPSNGLGFVVKVSPAIGESGPRWTFERVTGNTQSVVWTRETREVAMIQGKLAIDTIYREPNTSAQTEASTANTDTVTGSQAEANIVAQAEANAADTLDDLNALESSIAAQNSLTPVLMPPSPPATTTDFPRHSGSFLAVPAPQGNSPEGADGTTTVETTPIAPQFGFIEPPNYTQDAATNWFCSFGTSETSALPAPAQFDAKLLGRVVASLTDPKTYLATYGAFAYFLLRQHAQYQMSQTSFAVAVFEIIIKQNGEEMLLPRETFRQVAERIRPLMSPLDVAAHVSAGEFAVLLCSSDGADALRFARSLYGTLAGQSLLPEGVTAEEAVVVGVAACPETCKDPGELLAAAREAKEAALCSSRPYLLFP
ncbi:MAG: hypothetical protein C0507_15915 [Cyanobacteria bacterium PR.3.49]|nr:hypothetical protein [Cyanobacteria bacterium PR.3.49]